MLHWRQPVPLQKRPGVSSSQPGRLTPPEVPVEGGSHVGWAQEFPLSSNGDPVIPERLPARVPPARWTKGPRVSAPFPSPPLHYPRPAPGDTCACSLPSRESAGRRRRGHRLERLRGRGAEGAGRAPHGQVGTQGSCDRVPRCPVPGWPGTGRRGGGERGSMGVACAWCAVG